MKELVLTLLLPPTPFILIMLLGIVWPGQKAKRQLLSLSAVLLLVTSAPVIGKLASYPLHASGEAYENSANSDLPIIVPTAGVFQDSAGRWWPGKKSIMRYQDARKLGGPLFLVGGNPNENSPPEAKILATYFPQDSHRVTVVAEGRNSIESAIALKAVLPKESRIVYLATSPTHVLRMSAALKNQGVQVLAISSGRGRLDIAGIADFVPSFKGLSIFRQASYEYFGIFLYLVRGDIDMKDLF